MDIQLKNLAVMLYEIGAVKFGEFITKIGLRTPVYFDLRIIISHPKIMNELAKTLWQLAEASTDVKYLCGVPYTALPLATLISVEFNIPMLIKRKEAKAYGTKKKIEGNFQAGDSCVIIEDVITSGSSILETVDALKEEGLNVSEAFVVIDREQGGMKNIESKRVKVKSLYTVTKLMKYLVEADKVTSETAQDVHNYLKSCQATIPLIGDLCHKRISMRFNERAKISKNVLASKLLRLMESKQSSLCLAADLTKADDILQLAELTGPHIVVLKTHVDIIEDFNQNFISSLKNLAEKHKFLLMEDRKFSDIGNTVRLQYQNGIYKIAEWADLITVHTVPGPATIDALFNGLSEILNTRGIFLVAEMSSKDALTVGDYVQNTLVISEKFPEAVVGLVCQSNIISDPGMLQLTPGVKLSVDRDELGQQYNTPESVVARGADLVVVGRGITGVKDRLAATLMYKKEVWTAYEKRVK